MRTLFRWLAACALLGGAIWQGTILFQEWQTIPRKDFGAWRIEYASINLEESKQTELKLQARVEKTTDLKKISLPYLEIILTDPSDQMIASRVLSPQEWIAPDLLQDNRLLLTGIASGSEITSSIPLQIPEHAAGYRIRFFYP